MASQGPEENFPQSSFCICDLNDDAISGYTGAKLSGLKLDEATGYELEYMASGYFSPFSVYLITKYMRRIPVPLIEAAKIDGANEFQVFTKICIPICKGVITTCAILVFMDYWNMVEQPLLFFNDTDKYPLSIFLSKINAQEVGLAFAVATFYMIPSLLIFLYGEDQLVEGIAYQGGVKDRKWRVKR